MTALKLNLLVEAVKIHMKRDQITAEEAVAKYTLNNEDKAAILAAIT